MSEPQENPEQTEHEKKHKQLVADFRATFLKFESGTRVYKYLENLCLKNSQTFVPGDPEKTAYNCGAREIILRIDDLLVAIEKDRKPTETTKE